MVRLILSLSFTGAFTQTPGGTPLQQASEWQLRDAPIKPLVEERILASIIDGHMYEYQEDEKDEVKAIALRSNVHFVRLDGRGRIGIEVTSVSPWCGATGNCEVWIFDKKTGEQLVHGDGWEYVFRRTTHHEVFDFSVRQNMSAGSGVRYQYQFDGKVYKQVDSVGEPRLNH